MKAAWLTVVALIIVLGVVVIACDKEKRTKEERQTESAQSTGGQADELDLSSETLGIPLPQDELLKGNMKGLPSSFKAKEDPKTIWTISYSKCEVLALVLLAKDHGKPAMDIIVGADIFSSAKEVLDRQGCPYKTLKGIGIGSSMSDVLRAYGKPNHDGSFLREQIPEAPVILSYESNVGATNRLLMFTFKNEQVEIIELSRREIMK